MEKYDVFISCKSEDYPFAEQIYDFLKQNGVNAFLASREIRKLGESEYRKSITRALKDAEHLIIFASNADYIDSEWVAYEWDLFITAKLKGFKNGNIVTILHGVPNNEINMELWKYESMTLDDYKSGLMHFVETPSSRERKKRLEEEKKRQEAESRENEKRRLELEKNKKELLRFAKEYAAAIAGLNPSIARINDLMKKIGVDNRVCPVCKTANSLSNKYCTTCGATLSPVMGVPGAEYLLADIAPQIELQKKYYSSRSDCNYDYNSSRNSHISPETGTGNESNTNSENKNTDKRPDEDYGAGYYNLVSQDIGIVYRRGNELFFCLPGIGRKLKLNLSRFICAEDPLEEIRKTSISSSEKSSVSLKEHMSKLFRPFSRGLVFAENFAKKANLDVSEVWLIVMPNVQSLEKATMIKRVLKNKHVRIVYGPTQCALGASLDKISTQGGEIKTRTKCGRYEVFAEAGDGVLEIQNISYLTSLSECRPVDDEDMVKGILTSYLVTKSYLRDVLLIDAVGYNIDVKVKNRMLSISKDSSIPTKLWDEIPIKKGDVISLIVNDREINSLKATRDFDQLTIEIDAARVLWVSANDVELIRI